MKTEPTCRIYKPEETEAEQPAPLMTVKELGVRLRRRAGGVYDVLVRDTGEVLGMVARDESSMTVDDVDRVWRGWAWRLREDSACFANTRQEAVQELVEEEWRRRGYGAGK